MNRPPSPHDDIAARLASGVVALGMTLSDAQQQRLLAYISLLERWNRVHNLTAVRTPLDMVTRHLLDSLAVTPHMRGPCVLDVGTGAGLPGIPLAIALPRMHFTLLDSIAKKTRFLVQVVGELALSNVRIEARRVENYQPVELFDTVISRAFSSLPQFIAGAGHLCRPGGLLLAMKGRHPAAELHELPPGYVVDNVIHITVPGLNEERHAVCVRRAAT